MLNHHKASWGGGGISTPASAYLDSSSSQGRTGQATDESFLLPSSPGLCFPLGLPLSISLEVFQDEVGTSSAPTGNSVSGMRKMGKGTETGHYLIRSLPGWRSIIFYYIPFRETVPVL